MIIIYILLFLIFIAVLYASEKGRMFLGKFSVSKVLSTRETKRMNQLKTKLYDRRVDDREKLLNLFSEQNQLLIKDMDIIGHIGPKDYLKIKEQIDIYHKFKNGKLDKRLLNNLDYQFVSYLKNEEVEKLKEE